MASMDYEKAYDAVDRKGLWKMLQCMAWIGTRLLNEIKSFDNCFLAYMRISGEINDWSTICWSETRMCDVPMVGWSVVIG